MLTLIPNALERFLAEDDGQPVVMLNLLRFKPDGGRELYFRYIAMVGPLVTRYGGHVTYVGDGLSPLAAETGQSWDTVALVRYPSRRAFADMVADPDYGPAGEVRESALEEAVLQPMRTLPL